MVTAYISNCIRRAYTVISNSCIDIISIFYKITIATTPSFQSATFKCEVLFLQYNMYDNVKSSVI